MTARVAFSPDMPFVVTARGFVYRGKVYGQGEVFPWRALGLDEHELAQLWYTLKLDCLLPVAKPVATPPERVSVQQQTRREKRAQRR